MSGKTPVLTGVTPMMAGRTLALAGKAQPYVFPGHLKSHALRALDSYS